MLRDTFATFGTISFYKIICDDQGRSKGYGHVRFESAEAAEAAIKFATGMPLKGKNLHVSNYISYPERQSKWEMKAQTTNVNMDNMECEEVDVPSNKIPDDTRNVPAGSSTVIVAEGDDDVIAAQRSPKLTAERSNTPAQYLPPCPSASLFVRNLESSVTEATLFELFKTYGTVSSVHLCRDSNTHRSVGRGYVNYQNVADAQRAFELNYSIIEGRPCHITWSQPDPALRKHAQGKLYVGNLDEQISEKALYDTFARFGDVLFCQVATDDQGRPKGHGFVHYETVEDAERVINAANGIVLNGKKIYVNNYVPRQWQEGVRTRPTSVDLENGDSVTKEDVDPPFQQSSKIPNGIGNVSVGFPIPTVAERDDDLSGAVRAASKVAAQPSPKCTTERKLYSTAVNDRTSVSISEPPKYAVPQRRSWGVKPESASGDRALTPPPKKFTPERSTLYKAQCTGLEDQIISEDVDEYQPLASTAAPAKSTAEYIDILVSDTRKATGAQPTQHKQDLPQHCLTTEINMDEVLKLCEDLSEKLEDKDKSVKLKADGFILKAVACALADVPEANSAHLGEFIRQYNKVDISMAVVTPTGLMAPIIKDVGSKGLIVISKEATMLAKKARNRKLMPQEYDGGTFTVTNLRESNIDHFTAIINPRQSCNLAVGRMKPSIIPCLEGERGFKISNTIKVTLSSDHRVIDSAIGARWLTAFKGYLEDPTTLIL
ncbi:2-oxoacid dehydrogenases acyltransferase-domain-containing protein [Pisolithus albus]|nr:2-oxoacid dehydrogenases acyltransferase-domain-containing protein [Pisolithus albus]